MPGVDVKFVPNEEKLELRIRGPIVFPGYLNDPVLTRKAFDEEGYYCIGDAGRLKDLEHPEEGILFDGRISEDFKLNSGTWVCVSAIRARVAQYFGDLLSDIVVTGHDQGYVGLLAFAGPRMRLLAQDKAGKLNREKLMALPAVRDALQYAMQEMAANAKGSAQRVRRLLVMDQAADLDAGEVTDKGNLNQGKLLLTRKAETELLYAKTPPAFVLSL